MRTIYKGPYHIVTLEDGVFYIYFLGKNRRNKIGYFINGKFVTEKDKRKHLFKKFNAWGFNYYVLDFLVKVYGNFDIIVNEKRSRKKYILENFNGEKFNYFRNKYILNFQKQGYELQIFIPLNYFKTK